MSDKTPLSDLEKGIVAKLAGASFPPATASKRFAHSLSDGHVTELSPRGRKFLAFIAKRFRRQYKLTHAELEWIAEWIDYTAPKPEPKPELKPVVVDEPKMDAGQGDLFV